MLTNFDLIIMSSQKKMNKFSNNNVNTSSISSNNINNFTRKPRRSIKAEGNCLNTMLREGSAHVIDASKLGKRLSSEIWNSFGAIQVENDFSYPSIATKVVADGSSATVKICQFFVACSKCFSVFKYDGHAYGTTGLVKHVKICQGKNRVNFNTGKTNNNNSINNNNGHLANNSSHNNPTVHNQQSNTSTNHLQQSSSPSSSSTTNTSNNQSSNATPQPHHIMSANIVNGQVVVTTHQQKPRKPYTPRSKTNQPNLKSLVRAIEDLRCEQNELKQKIHDLITMMSASSYVSQIQIIPNDEDKVDEEIQEVE